MVYVILAILKTTGIALLFLLALLLAVVLAVLFVPVRYRVEGDKFEQDGAFLVRAKVSWLLHLVSVRFSYDGAVSLRVRLFGWTVYDWKKRERYAAKKAVKERRRATKQAEKQARQHRRDAREETGGSRADAHDREENGGNRVDTDGPAQRRPQPEEAQKTSERATFWDKLKTFAQMLLGILQNLRYTICRFCDKIKQIRDAMEYYGQMFEDTRCRAAFARCKKQLLAIWKNIRPKKLRLAVHAGFDDPSVTGQILSWYSMLYPWIYQNITLKADFERSVLAGTFFCQGRITAFVLLKAAWILYFDQDIKYFLQLWKKEETGNG